MTCSKPRGGAREGADSASRGRTRGRTGACPPPSSTTGVEVTVGIHWYRGTIHQRSVHDVLQFLVARYSESVVVLDRGRHGYTDGYLVGNMRVYVHPERLDMGVMFEVEGEGCEVLGSGEIAHVALELGARASRLDLAVDGCPFEPARLRDAWRAGNVRTRVKVMANARRDRLWRNCEWTEKPDGDMFRMGRRSSTQYARCYDRRGLTRFELELKGEAAAAGANELLEALRSDANAFRMGVLGWVRRFVDFVDRESRGHASRCQLLPFWEAFVAGVDVARVTLAGAVQRTIQEVLAWVDRQVAPSLALLVVGFGKDEVLRIAERGHLRWKGRHRAMLAALEASRE